MPADQLVPIDLVTPGFRGLNTVQSGSLMDPAYCVQAQNCVIDTSGRISARQGITPQTYLNSSLTFTAPPAGTSATLSLTWTQPSGTYLTYFSDGEVRAATFTNGATTCTWTGALTGSPTITFTVSQGIYQLITFTAPPTGTSGTITAAWTLTTGSYQITFSDGETRSATLTNGSTTVLWTPALTGTPQVTAMVNISVQSVFEYNHGGGVYSNIAAWAGGITSNLVSPTNDLGGAVNVNNGRWYFQNFNNKVVGFQDGQKFIVYNGAGTFATVVESQGTAPAGGIGCAAFGRVWQVASDGQTIRYSGLLDETDWGSISSGTIDMHTIWSDGTDVVTAIFAYNASLVVCGLKHIIFFTDGRGSMLGIDPTQMYVFDVIVGTGVVSQWTVDYIGELDVVFLGPNGLQSLQRLTTARDNPTSTLSRFNRDILLSQLSNETYANVSGAFNPVTGFYVLGLPVSLTAWCFDMRRRFLDETNNLCSITTTWNMAITAITTTHLPQTLIARASKGTVGIYSGYSDEGSSYVMQYISPWMNLGQQVAQRLKMLKRLEFILFTAGNVTFNATWSVDFNRQTGTTSQTVSNQGASSQYGVAQYGIGQYGGGSNLYIWKYPAHIRGQYYQISISALITGVFALQQAQLAAKIGRVA